MINVNKTQHRPTFGTLSGLITGGIEWGRGSKFLGKFNKREESK